MAKLSKPDQLFLVRTAQGTKRTAAQQYATQQLVDAHASYIRHWAYLLAKRSAHSHAAAEDLALVGQCALLEAIGRFDCGTGVRLWTFAARGVAAAMQESCTQEAREAALHGSRAPYEDSEPIASARRDSAELNYEGFDLEEGDDEDVEGVRRLPGAGDEEDESLLCEAGPTEAQDRRAEMRPTSLAKNRSRRLDPHHKRDQGQIFVHFPDERSQALARIVAHALSEGSLVERALRAEEIRLLRRLPNTTKTALELAESARYRQQLNREIAARRAGGQLNPPKVHDDPAWRAELRDSLATIEHTSAEAIAKAQSSPLGCAALQSFRSRALGGRLTASPSEVGRWIEEQAAKEGPPAEAYLRVPLPDRPEGQLPAARAQFADWLIEQAKRLRDDDSDEPALLHPEPPQTLAYAEHAAQPKTIAIRPDGLLAELKTLAVTLCGALGWREAEAVVFVLSGRWPIYELRGVTQTSPVYPAATKIVLEVDPRSDASEVKRLYQRRRESLGITREGQAMDMRSLMLAVFAEENWRPGLSWDKLRDRWRADHHQDEGRLEMDDWHAKKFGRECRRAWSRVTGERWPQARDWVKRVPVGLKDDPLRRLGFLLEEIARERRTRGLS